jgi:hypothetical protein
MTGRRRGARRRARGPAQRLVQRPAKRPAQRPARTLAHRLAPVLLLAAACTAPAARAAEWRFDPVLTGLVQYTDDPLLVPNAETGASESAGRRSDELFSLDVALTLTRRTPRSALTFVANPRIERYREQSELDNVQWFGSAGWTWDKSQRTNYDALVSYTRWERTRFDFTDPAVVQPTAGGRTSYETLAGRAGVTTQLGPRTSLDAGAAYRTTSYTNFTINIGDADGDGTDAIVPVEDNASLDLNAALGYSLSPLASLGAEVRNSRLDEGLYGKRTVRRALANYNYGAAEHWTLDVSAGYAKSSVDEVGELGSTDEPSAWVGSFVYRRRVGSRPGGSFALGGSRDLTGSGGVLGLSLTESAYASLTLPVRQFSRLQFVANGGRFEPVASTVEQSRTDSFGFRADYSMAFGPHWSAVASAEYQKQNSPFEELSLDYYIVGLGVRWAPYSVRETVVNP